MTLSGDLLRQWLPRVVAEACLADAAALEVLAGFTQARFVGAVAAAVGPFMFGRARSISRAALPADVQLELDALAADGILDTSSGTYRASHVALYSCYQRCDAPA